MRLIRGVAAIEVDDGAGELRSGVLLQEVAAAGEGGVRHALRARDRAAGTHGRRRAVTGSPSENAVRKGLSQRASTSHAARLAARRRVVGRGRHQRAGTARAPAL